jgi:LEA14-like dessication related protein
VPRRRIPAYKARRSVLNVTRIKTFCRRPSLRRLAVGVSALLCFAHPMKSLWLRVFPALACLFIVSSCNSSYKFVSIPVAITEYRPTALDTQATLTLRFTNENVFPLAFAKTSGKLYLHGTYVGHFEIKEAMGVQRLGSATRNTALFIENAAYVKQLRATAATSTIPYRLETVMMVEISEEKSKIKTESSGQIDGASLGAAPAEELKR